MSNEMNFSEAPASINLRFNYKGYNGVMLTLRGPSGLDVLQKLDAALAKLDAIGATPHTGTPPRSTHGSNENGSVPQCPQHGPMKPSKHGGYYCPKKIAEDGGNGKPIYCKAKAE